MTHSHTTAPAGEKRHVAVSDAMVEAALAELTNCGVLDDIQPDLCREIVIAALTAATAAEPGEGVADDPVSFQWRTIDGWVEASIGGTIGQRRDYAKQMAANCGLGYRELYAHPAHPLPLKEEVERVLEPFALVAEVDIGESETDEDLFRPVNDERHARAPRLTVGDLRAARILLSRIRAGAREGWRPEDLIPGRAYESRHFGLVKYAGLDNYMGDVTHKFQTIAGTRYTYTANLDNFLAPKAAAAPSPEAKGGPRP